MTKLRSRDGTLIAIEKKGSGLPVILVAAPLAVGSSDPTSRLLISSARGS